MTVDHRPHAERAAAKAIRAMWFGLAGCVLLGAGVGATLAVHYTTPKETQC